MSSSGESAEPVVFPGVLPLGPLGQLVVGAEPAEEILAARVRSSFPASSWNDCPCGLSEISSSEYCGGLGLDGAGFSTFCT